MAAIAITVILSAAGLLVLWRAEPLLVRLVAVAERYAGVAEKQAERPTLPAREAIPSDLLLIANKESEDWAREAAQKRLVELYAEYGDWDEVRNVVAISGGLR